LKTPVPRKASPACKRRNSTAELEQDLQALPGNLQAIDELAGCLSNTLLGTDHNPLRRMPEQTCTIACEIALLLCSSASAASEQALQHVAASTSGNERFYRRLGLDDGESTLYFREWCKHSD